MFAIPVYLRNEEDYFKDEQKAREKTIENERPFERDDQVAESHGGWPPWEFNDIVRYLQIGIDKEGYFRFLIFGIDHKYGYKRIPICPGARRKSEMWAIDYKNYFRDCTIQDSNGVVLRVGAAESHIKATLAAFLSKMKNKMEKEKKYFDTEHWLMMVECCDIKTLIAGNIEK